MTTFTYALEEYVVLQNLQKTPELNGRYGAVQEHLTDKGRLTVKLFEDGKLVNVKEDNLKRPSKDELKVSLKAQYEKLSIAQLEKILKSEGVDVDTIKTKDDLVKVAIEKQVFPDPSQKKKKGATANAPQQDLDPNELIEVPGGSKMTRREMWEQADALDRMTIPQMRERLRFLNSKSPQEIRATVPAMRHLSDFDIQMQVRQFQQYVANPHLKKQQVDALRSGDFSKLSQSGIAQMDDESLRREAKMKLELFLKDPADFRAKYLPDQQELSDQDIEATLRQQANADAKTLKAMRAAASGGQVDLSSLSDEDLKRNAQMQLKAFDANPKKFRKQMEDQNPAVKNMTDEELRFQLESLSTMSAEDVRAMQSMARNAPTAAGGSATAGAQPNLDNMTGEQLSSMFKLQRDMFRRDPKAFKKMAPHMAGMPDSMIQAQLDSMAEMSPENLKMYMSMTNKFSGIMSKFREPLDRISGGRGQQIIMVLLFILAALVLYFFITMMIRFLAYLFPTTFGYSAGATTGANAGGPDIPAAGGKTAPVQQVEVNVDEDAFFQENDDL